MAGLCADPAPRAGLELSASPEPGWPQWRGPRRDGISHETGLLPQWPEGGPRLLWTSANLGRGYSSPVLSGGRIFLTGDVGEDLLVFALDLEGKRLWQTTNGQAWKDPYPGARACGALRDGRLFHLNAHGRVTCLDPASGRELWAVDIIERFGGKVPTWALGECLLVDGPRVIVTPGGSRGSMAALDARTGATVWTAEPLRLDGSSGPAHERLAGQPGETDPAGYASPVLVQQGKRRLIVSCSLRHSFGVDADTGALLWTRALETRYQVIAATPVLVADGVFVTAPDSTGGKLYRLLATDAGIAPETAWTSPLDTCHGGLVVVGNDLFGSWYRRRRGWACVDTRTGAIRYETADLPMGSVIWAEGRLYCLSQEGEMTLIQPRPDRFEFTGRFRLVSEHEKDVWAHPVILDGRLYLRYHGRLFCYDIRAR
jgi:outer membrane protein assembly factor BamB